MLLLGITSEIVVLLSLTTHNFWLYATNRLLKLPVLPIVLLLMTWMI